MTRWSFRFVVRSDLFAPALSSGHGERCVCMVCCQPVHIEVAAPLWYSARAQACLIARERYGEIVRILSWKRLSQ